VGYRLAAHCGAEGSLNKELAQDPLKNLAIGVARPRPRLYRDPRPALNLVGL
jgi:hypothetical protein